MIKWFLIKSKTKLYELKLLLIIKVVNKLELKGIQSILFSLVYDVKSKYMKKQFKRACQLKTNIWKQYIKGW